MITTPIHNSYWIIPSRFLAGEYPRNHDHESSVPKLQALLAAGIRVFIDLTTSLDGLLPYRAILRQIDPQAEHHTFPVPDMNTPLAKTTTCNILDEIDSALARGKGVYLHCWGGVGRTGDAAVAKLGELWTRCLKSGFREAPETQHLDYTTV